MPSQILTPIFMVVDLFLQFRLLIKPPSEKTLKQSLEMVSFLTHRLTTNDKLCFCIIISTVQLFFTIILFYNF